MESIPEPEKRFNPGSPIESSEVIRALHAALAAIDKPGTEGGGANLPALTTAGKAWNTEEDQALGDQFDSGRSVGDIAKSFQRTRGSIASRLVTLGKVPDRQSAFLASVPLKSGTDIAGESPTHE